MNVCVNYLMFSVSGLFYRINFDSQVGTPSLCHLEDVSSVNETITLDHDIKGLEESEFTLRHS